MSTYAFFLVSCLLATLTLAAPIWRLPGQTTPNIGIAGTVQQTTVQRSRSGPQALAAAHAKYNKPLTQEQAAAALKLLSLSLSSPVMAANSVTATPVPNDAEYVCPVTIGNQTVYLDFDTGSSDFWMFSSNLPAGQQVGHNLYNPTKSKNSKKVIGFTWNITYSDGATAAGDVYTDTVTVGGLAIPNQAVELASKMSSDLSDDTDCDGVFGLGFNTLNNVRPTQKPNFFFTAMQQKALKRTVFTADLKKGKPGSYEFGLINAGKYQGSINYTPVDSSRGYWGFTSTGYGIGSNYTSQSLTGIADTGTSLLLLPDAVVNAYWSRVPGAFYDSGWGAYTFPCASVLPSFSLGVKTSKYVIPGSYMNYGPVTTTTCYGGLQTSNGIGFNVFGDVFLKAVFVVFDATGPRIGFANKTLT